MPSITVSTGPLSKEQKKDLTSKITEVCSEIIGAPVGYHQVYINEYAYDSMSSGNKTVEEIIAAMNQKN